MSRKIKRPNFTEKQRKTAAVIFFLAFLLFCGLVTWFVGRPMVDFVSEPEKFRDWVDSHGIFGEIAFVGMMFFQVVVAFVPGEPLEIGAGYAFGAIEGTILCVIGITLGSLLVFLLVRKFGIKFVEIFFDRKKIQSLRFLRNKKSRSVITFLVFFLPGTPKDLITYFVGLTDIKFSHFLFLTSVARLPSVITSTLGGNALGGKEYIIAILVFALTTVLSLLGLTIYRFIAKKRNKHK